MNLFELNQKIVNKSVPSIVIFEGDEWKLIDLYIEQMCKFEKLSIQNTDTPLSILSPQHTISLLGDKLLYVSRYNKDIINSQKSWKNIKYLGSNKLVLIYTYIDKRSKFYEYFKNNIVEVDNQPINTIKIMLKSKTSLCESALDRLISACKNSYSRCCIELDKIKTLSNIYNINEDESYKRLSHEGVMSESFDESIDVFVDDVMNKNKYCYDDYVILKKLNISNMQIIGWLYNAFRNQLIVQTVKYASTESTGLNYYIIKQALSRNKIYTNNELINAINIIKQTEQGIKFGTISEDISIDYIISSVMV